MGAWGHGPFEDDAALDFVWDIEGSDNPKGVIIDALDRAVEANYLESDEGSAAIVSAAYVDSVVNGTKYTTPEMSEPYEVDTFPSRFPELDLSDLRTTAVKALEKVIGGDSELRELWDESGEPAWQQGIQEMLGRLR